MLRERERNGGVDSFASPPLMFTWVFPSADKRFGEPRLPLSVNICLTTYPILHRWLVAQCMLGKSLLSLPPCYMTPHQTTALKCSIYRLNRWQKYFKMTKISLSAIKTEKQLKYYNYILAKPPLSRFKDTVNGNVGDICRLDAHTKRFSPHLKVCI